MILEELEIRKSNCDNKVDIAYKNNGIVVSSVIKNRGEDDYAFKIRAAQVVRNEEKLRKQIMRT